MDIQSSDPVSAGQSALVPSDSIALGITASISVLHDEILLEVFDCVRRANEKAWLRRYLWLRLAHVCRRWQCIVFASPSRLRLQLYCTYGTDVYSLLEHWPSLPISIDYPKWPDGKEDDIWDSLKHEDRVQEVNISMEAWAMVDHVEMIEVAMPVLEDLAYECEEEEVTLPDTFLGGYAPRLRTLHLGGFVIPAQLPFFLSATGLVCLRLFGRPHLGLLPEQLLAYLDVMPQLETLIISNIIDSESPNPAPRRVMSSPSERVMLLKLTTFGFSGSDRYLDALLSQLDAPQLTNLTITILHTTYTSSYKTPHLPSFIRRAANLKPDMASVCYSEVSMTVGVRALHQDVAMWLQVGPLSLEPEVGWQVAEAKQISDDMSYILASVETLTLHTTPTEAADVADPAIWRSLLACCRSVKLIVVPSTLSAPLANALTPETDEQVMDVLPALRELQVLCHGKDDRRGSIRLDAFGPFSAARRKADREVLIHYTMTLSDN
ncbi:hypothetical protein BC834DRAFT_887153 [Gloeopeniophorella convolvens]|nr:hypothetical protein BC834DRAFT_887153 [Gloeopeniophorella convolvens]